MNETQIRNALQAIPSDFLDALYSCDKYFSQETAVELLRSKLSTDCDIHPDDDSQIYTDEGTARSFTRIVGFSHDTWHYFHVGLSYVLPVGYFSSMKRPREDFPFVERISIEHLPTDCSASLRKAIRICSDYGFTMLPYEHPLLNERMTEHFTFCMDVDNHMLIERSAFLGEMLFFNNFTYRDCSQATRFSALDI